MEDLKVGIVLVMESIRKTNLGKGDKMETIKSIPTSCPECNEDWEFGCTTEKHDDGTILFQCWGCGRDFKYKPSAHILKGETK